MAMNGLLLLASYSNREPWSSSHHMDGPLLTVLNFSSEPEISFNYGCDAVISLDWCFFKKAEDRNFPLSKKREDYNTIQLVAAEGLENREVVMADGESPREVPMAMMAKGKVPREVPRVGENQEKCPGWRWLTKKFQQRCPGLWRTMH